MSRILIVEDNRRLLRLYRESLEHEGHEVFTAKSVSEARALLMNESLNVVVMEIQWGECAGFVLLSEIAARRLPVIINTAFEELRWDFRTWCAEALVLKSSDCNELKTAVRNVCSKHCKADLR